MQKIRCQQCSSVFGIKNPDITIKQCPKCKAPFELKGTPQPKKKKSGSDDFISLLDSLDDKKSNGSEPVKQEMQRLPETFSMQHDVQRRRRARNNQIAIRSGVAASVIIALVVIGIVGTNYVTNMMDVRELRADWAEAKDSAQESLDLGRYQSAESRVGAFGKTIERSEAKGAGVTEIQDQIAAFYRKINADRDAVQRRIVENLNTASKHRLSGDLGLARPHLDEARQLLDSIKEQSTQMAAAHLRWITEHFLVLASPVSAYEYKGATEQTMLEFAGSTSVAIVHAHLLEHPELEAEYPEESLAVIVIYHWAQIVEANKLNEASEWEQSIPLLRDARDAAIKHPEIKEHVPVLLIAIDQTLTLTIYDRISTSRAHISQLIGLELLPEAVLACKDLIQFVTDLEQVMRTTNPDDFTNPEARQKARGFRSYANALVVELQWRILRILIDTSKIQQDPYDKLLEERMKTKPAELAGACAKAFKHIDGGVMMLGKEIQELDAINRFPRLQALHAAIDRYHAAWKNLAAASANYAAKIGTAKAFDKFVNAGDEASAANDALESAIDSIPAPPEETEE